MSEERRTVVVGGTYGHLRVIEELAARDKAGRRRFRAECLVVEDGAMCMAQTVKMAHELTGHRYRACKRHSEAHAGKTRARFGQLNLPRGGRG
ncbi:MAG TPA: hypothetical protein VF668_01385 [Pyrinomonadaceae bacterium]|jgi:hypothetical protein